MKKEAQQPVAITGISALQLVKEVKDSFPKLIQQINQLEVAVGQLEQLKAKLEQAQSGSAGEGGTGGQSSADDHNSLIMAQQRVNEYIIALGKMIYNVGGE